MDLMRVAGPDRWGANASAGGMSGEVDEAVSPEIKATWGPLAYVRSALEVVSDPPSYRVVLTGTEGTLWEGEALNVLVANGRTVAGGIPVSPTAVLDDGLLDVVVVKAGPLASLAGFASLCLLGRHLEHELVVHHRVTSLEVGSDPPMPFNVDGELVGETPVEYSVRPGALRVLAAADAPGLGRS
jgi:diacylglycerol kinase (ATP)